MASNVSLPEIEQQTVTKPQLDPGWSVIVWNDPVNLMSYVTHVFRKVLGFDKGTAHKHMMEVHHRGKSVVARENKERAELYWQKLQQHGLKVTIKKAS